MSIHGADQEILHEVFNVCNHARPCYDLRLMIQLALQTKSPHLLLIQDSIIDAGH